MNLTVEQTLRPTDISAFYSLYVAAFEPLKTRAAARHLLTADEFAEEMTDQRIDKYVVSDGTGTPIALTTFTADLSVVTWISPEYYAARYPQQTARDAVFYLGYTLVHPRHARHGVFTLMTDRLIQRMVDARGVCVFDVCAYNDAGTVGRVIAALPNSADVKVGAVDVQTYYAASFDVPVSAGAGA